MKKRKDETNYREPTFGIIPRSKLIPLEIEGIKRAWDFVMQNARKSDQTRENLGHFLRDQIPAVLLLHQSAAVLTELFS